MLNTEQLNGMPPSERLEFLKDNAYKSEQGRYFKRFTTDELLQLKDKYVAEATVLMNIEDEFTRIKADYKGRIDEKKESQEIELKKISLKGVFLNGDTYLFPDYDNGIMYIYDEAGALVDMREIKPEERQLKMVTLPKAANE